MTKSIIHCKIRQRTFEYVYGVCLVTGGVRSTEMKRELHMTRSKDDTEMGNEPA